MNKRFTPTELVEGFSQLHTLPEIYFRIKKVVDRPDAQSSDLVRELGTDPALTGRVLRVVNSPLYAANGKVETLSRAVSVLGTRSIHDLVLDTCVTGMIVRKSMGGFDLREHWRRSFLAGMVTRSLGESLKLLDRDRLFIEGLLSRIGELIMHERGGKIATIVAQHAVKKDLALSIAQRNFLGCHYGEVGAVLLRKWALPESICVAVEKHLDPVLESEVPDVGILRMGTMLCTSMERDESIEMFIESLEKASLTHWNLEPERFEEIHGACQAELDAVQQAFLPAASAA